MPTTNRSQTTTTGEPLPIWMAALLASECRTYSHHGVRKVEWQCLPDQAVYTNHGYDPEILFPFGIPVGGGETVMVTWLPGDTGYTVRLERKSVAA